MTIPQPLALEFKARLEESGAGVVIIEKTHATGEFIESLIRTAPGVSEVLDHWEQSGARFVVFGMLDGDGNIHASFANSEEELRETVLPAIAGHLPRLRRGVWGVMPVLADYDRRHAIAEYFDDLQRALNLTRAFESEPSEEPRLDEPFALHAARDMRRLVRAGFYVSTKERQLISQLATLLEQSPTIKLPLNGSWCMEAIAGRDISPEQLRLPASVFSFQFLCDDLDVAMRNPAGRQEATRRLALVLDTRSAAAREALDLDLLEMLPGSNKAASASSLLMLPIDNTPASADGKILTHWVGGQSGLWWNLARPVRLETDGRFASTRLGLSLITPFPQTGTFGRHLFEMSRKEGLDPFQQMAGDVLTEGAALLQLGVGSGELRKVSDRPLVYVIASAASSAH